MTGVRHDHYARKSLARNPKYWRTLDRIAVLGSTLKDGTTVGHEGCVNALSWSCDGESLISSGDDCRICIWKARGTDILCDTVIETGHTGNVFSAQYLPSSTQIATASGDRQVRVFDVTRAGRLSAAEACVRVFRCHKGRAKKIVTEHSPSYFLSCSEDRTIRGHDLRTPHTCPSCPPPLLRLPYALSCITMSPLAPYYFVVAGESPYAHLFDRRMIPRVLKAEWGVPCPEDELVTCVRRFGRTQRSANESPGEEHVTGARLSSSNAHELVLSWSSDATYLYSLHDEPANTNNPKQTSVLPSSTGSPIRKRQRRSRSSPALDSHPSQPEEPTPAGDLEPGGVLSNLTSIDELRELMSVSDEEFYLNAMLHLASGDDSSDDNDDDNSDRMDIFDDDDFMDEDHSGADSEGELWHELRSGPDAPIVFPRRRFAGAFNVLTIKDVNFVGPNDEYIVSGSDDGNWFLWDKETGALEGIWEGDSQVVNVIEPHPYMPLLAVSGIDETVKLFAPGLPSLPSESAERASNASGDLPAESSPPQRSASRLAEKEEILSRNADPRTLNVYLRRMNRADLGYSSTVRSEGSSRALEQGCLVMVRATTLLLVLIPLLNLFSGGTSESMSIHVFCISS